MSDVRITGIDGIPRGYAVRVRAAVNDDMNFAMESITTLADPECRHCGNPDPGERCRYCGTTRRT